MKTVGRFQLIAEIKRGPHTITYRGFDPEAERLVLVKVATVPHTSDDPALQRLETEARVYQRLRHPLIARLVETGLHDIYPYLVIEYIEGPSLRDLLQRLGPLPLDVMVYGLVDLLTGLQRIHDAGLIHRDLKPENLILAGDGRMTICDFDLARFADETAEMTAGLTGSIGYFAPEVIYGETATVASDLFAVGVIAYEMLTGARPFQRDSTDAEMRAITRQEPVPLARLRAEIPEPLSELVMQLLAKKPADRPASAREALKRLQTRFALPAEKSRRQALAAFARAPVDYESVELISAEATEGVRRRFVPWVAAGALATAATLVAAVLLLSPPGQSTRQVAEVRTQAADTLAAPVTATTPAESLASPMDSVETGTVAEEPSKPPLQQASEEKPPAGPSGQKAGAPKFAGKALHFRVIPWAHIFVDGDSLGASSDLGALFISAGEHRLRLKNPRMPELELPLAVDPHTPDTLTYDLLTYFAQIYVEVTPWAYVYLNGNEIQDLRKQSPLVLLPGQYTFRFIHPNLGTRTQTLQVQAGESRHLVVNMFEQRP